MINPYRIVAPAYISFSGGRTSAYLLRKILDAHDGILPEGVHVIFANTGRERPETLDFVDQCARRWNVPVHWVEYQDADPRWREVSYETASRDGEPFAALIKKRKYLPNAKTRFCTSDLKIKVASAWMSARGYEGWTALIGFRYDEASRVAKLSLPPPHPGETNTREAPLFAARVTKRDVMAFWSEQPFDLRLLPHEGNCDICFLKGHDLRLRLLRDRPDLGAWWIEQEAKIGAFFVNVQREPGGYATNLDLVRRLPLLPHLFDDTHVSLDCACTD